MSPDGTAWLLSAAGFALAMSASPGPNNAMVAASGASFGLRRSLPHMLGIAVGFPVMLVAVALGAGEALRGTPWLRAALRWVGAAYLLWLALRLALAHPEPTERPVRQEARAAASPGAARPLSFLQAALFQWVNPKAWITAAGAVVAYTGGAGGTAAMLVQAAVLAVIFVAVCLPSVALWAAVGAGAARLLRTGRALRALNLGLSAMLLASVAALLLEGEGGGPAASIPP